MSTYTSDIGLKFRANGRWEPARRTAQWHAVGRVRDDMLGQELPLLRREGSSQFKIIDERALGGPMWREVIKCPVTSKC